MIYDSSQDEMLVYVGIIDTEKWKNKSWDDSSQGSFFFFFRSKMLNQLGWKSWFQGRQQLKDLPATRRVNHPKFNGLTMDGSPAALGNHSFLGPMLNFWGANRIFVDVRCEMWAAGSLLTALI